MRVWSGLARAVARLGSPVACGRGFAWSVGLCAIVLVGVLGGCASRTPAPVFGWDENAPAPEGYYRVQRGDTLGEVAERLKLKFATLARWNELEPPYKIISGGLLRIVPPDGGGQVAGAPAAKAGKAEAAANPAADREPDSAEHAPADSAKVGSSRNGSRLRWQWPLRGPIRQTFVRGNRTRSGIRIGGKPGAKVLAAEAGEVVYSGSGLKGYGNLIIVRHNKNYLSAYGFNRRLLVPEGGQVKRGQVVAEVGQAAGGAWLLHFEIRNKGTAVDPLVYLPKAR